MHIYSDFDGTIALCDVTDLVLQAFAAPAWEDIEAAWRLGEIDAATCMRRQIALIDAPRGALDALLDSVGIDTGFSAFVDWCEVNHVPLTVVSDGVDYFIRRILGKHGLGHIPVFANRLISTKSGLRLEHPWRKPSCSAGSGVCKCAIESAGRHRSVYIGDGRSDECVGPKADTLFAKDKLAAFCQRRRLPFIPFATFDDVRRRLASGVNGSGGPPVASLAFGPGGRS